MTFDDPKTEEKAPEGKIRFIGHEGGVPYHIADLDAPMTHQQMDELAHQHRGVGIFIYVYNERGECVFTS